jgi:xylan 1,4-beta-xylosidase
MMSYWTFSDVFEEQGVIQTPFYGGFGLIAEGGLPKAAFNAFAMLHRLGDQRSQPDLANALVTRRSDGTFAIAIWNYAEPTHSVHIMVDEAGSSGTPRYHVEILDPDHGSALDAWRSMGSPVSPTEDQYKHLRREAAVTRKLEGTSTFMLPSHSLALVEVESH